MKMKVIAVLSGIVSLGAIGAASAADMAVKAPPPAPVPVFSWTGFYVGVDVGATWSSDRWHTTCIETGFPGTACPNVTANPADAVRFFFNNPSKYEDTSFRAGGHVGYNWQAAPTWVLGVEADAAWMDNRDTRAGIPGAENPAIAGAPGLDRSSVKHDWDASFRARLGFLVTPNVMIYGTGGGAYTHVSASVTCGTAYPVGWCAGAVPVSSGISDDLWGWTAGVGIEGAFWGNWLARAEWRHSDYGSLNGTFFANVPINAVTSRIDIRTDQFTVGVSYKFGGPVVAKY